MPNNIIYIIIIGSRQSIDEMHPKAIHELHQKYKTHGGSRSPNRHRKLVRNSKNDDNIRMDGESDYSRLSHNENFDQQIEEMMRAIVEQGKLIHDQLQRFNDKTTASSKSNSSNFQPKVNVQAQVHSPLATKNESGSTPSSLNDSTSTSTSINVLSRDEPLPKSYSHNNKSKPMLASADFIPSPNTIHSLTDNNMSNRRDFTPNRDSNLKYPSKSYDNYETIFPTSPVSPNSTFQGNTSVDQLPVSRLQSENGVYKHIANIHSNISTALPKDDVQKTASSSSVAWLTSSQSSMPRAGSNLKGPNTSNNLDSEPIRNISIEQTTNHDFQIVDITNVSKVGKEHEDKRKSSLLTENSIHDTSFSSSSTSESANKNTQLSVRGSAISDRLNQSVDLMNLSVLENSNNSGDPLSVYGYLPTNHHNQGNLKDYSGTENSIELNSEADIRFKRDKLILKTIHSELTKLVQMNDRLAFAEDSVDRLKIAIRQVQDQDMLDTERQCNSAPNLSMSAEEAEEHIACAKEQLERLKVANDDASKAIEKNKGSIEDIDKKVKAGKATVKNLEYDVNVIEKESRKLNKELEKVLKLEIGEEGDDHSSETILDDEKKYSSGGVKSEDIAVLSESLDISVCTEDVTLMSKLNGSPDNSNTEDSVDSTAMFPELLQLGSANGNSARQISNTYLLKQEDLNPNPSIRVDPDRQTQLLSITTDINAVHRVGCFEDIRSAINGSPAGSGASSSGNSTGNSSDKSVRFNDTEIIHPHHEYTTSSSSMTPDLPDLPDEPASRGSYTMAIKTGCNSSILSLLAKSAKNSSTSKPNLKSQRSGEEKIANGAGSNVDVDTDNSDTGLSSLHSSSDEATFEPGTLV